MMLAAVIFDFDGVILDSEPTHMAAFQEVLARAGHSLTRDDYYAKYLGFDDRGAFSHMAADMGFALDEPTLERWIAGKSTIVLRELGTSPSVLPGAVEFVTALAAQGIPLAVASGALHAEVRAGLASAGLLPHFRVIVGADDTSRSKPDPEPYLAALAALGVEAARSIAIEDSPAGLISARGAGLLAVGVTNTYPASALAPADVVVDRLTRLTAADLDELLLRRAAGRR